MSDVYITNPDGDDEPLPPGSRIKFVYGDQSSEHIEVHVVRDGLGEDGVELYATGVLQIVVGSINSIRVRRERRYGNVRR